MKILTIHNFHRKGSASGDDQVYINEASLLEDNGNQVIRYFVCNDDFDQSGIIRKCLQTFGMLWSRKNYKAIKELIQREQPDIVHVHTFFPLLSPSVLYAAKKSGCKVVSTLHDTRFVCPCATSLRGASICNLCEDGHYFRMCKYKCFKDSRLQSFIVASIFKFHRAKKSFYNQIDQYICLNDNQINLLVGAGYTPEKITKKYNFMPDITSKTFDKMDYTIPSRYVVFYGRIGKEKGIVELMKIWDEIDDIPLVVMGGGPLENEFSIWAKTKKNVWYLGYIQHDKCLAVVRGCDFVVFPSIWYEGCSMVIIESECVGKAVIATDLGFSSEAIKDGFNGYKIPFADIECFVKKIKSLWSDPQKAKSMGENARRDYEDKYMPENNYNQLISIYSEALSGKEMKNKRKLKQ